MSDGFDLAVVGTGPASAFFLQRWLERAPARARVVVFERGPRREHAWRLQQHPADTLLEAARAEVSDAGSKAWKFAHAFGGTSNLWWGNTPRLLPADFELRTRYGVGEDWPLSYDDLEPHYCAVEDLMGVAGDSKRTPFRRSRPYPQPAHRPGAPTRRLAEAYPDSFFVAPCARPTRAIGRRPACCGSGVCGRCPVDAKFTVLNGLGAVFEDPRVELRLGALVAGFDITGAVANAVRVEGGEPVRAALVAVGAGAIHNPHLLLRSGLDHPNLGRRLFEQASVEAEVDLAGLDNFGGTTSITGHGYMLYDGDHRRTRAAALIETWDAPSIRLEPGRWRERMRVQLVFEDLPQPANRVIVDPDDERRAKVEFGKRSAYAHAARERAQGDLERVLAPLPVEAVRVVGDGEFRDTEGHALGTTMMSDDPKRGVVDRDLVHHRVRNLLVLGGSVFPVGSPANPTLTIGALSRRAAGRLFD